MIEIGRVCVKTAGRDAGKYCVIVEILDNNFVLIDGQTRRRKCNILHIEPTKHTLPVKKGASHEDVKKQFSGMEIEITDTTPKQKTEGKKGQKAAIKQKAAAVKKESKNSKPKKKKA